MAKWNLGKIVVIGGLAVAGVWVLRNRSASRAYQGFLGPQYSNPGYTSGGFASSPDIPTVNCTPAGYAGSSSAMYCNPPGQMCGFGSTCADARVNYCQRYAPGGVCENASGGVAADQGLPGQGPIVSSGFNDLTNTYGWAAASQMTGISPQMGFAQGNQASGQGSPYGGYGYNGMMGPPPTQTYGGGFGYGGYPSSMGYPQMPMQMPGYGYGYPQMPMGYPSMGYPSYGYGSMMPPPSPYGYY